MQAKMVGVTLILAASTAGAAPVHHPAGGMGKSAGMQPCCPMCAQMMQGGQKMPGMKAGRPGGMMGGMMTSPMMGQMPSMTGRTQGVAAPPAVTVASDGTIVVLRGTTLYKYSANLKLRGSVQLPARVPAAPMDMAPPAARPGR